MAQRLRGLVLKEVSLVPAGANQHARVVISKAAASAAPPDNDAALDSVGPTPAAALPGTKPRKKAKGTGVIAKILAALSGEPVDKAAASGTALDFKGAIAAQAADRLMDQVRSELWQYESALQNSIRTIIEDDTVADKKAAIAASLTQFQTAVVALIPEMEAADAAAPEDADDVDKNAALAVKTPEAGDAGQVRKDKEMTDTAAAAAAPAVTADIQKMIADAVTKALADKDVTIAKQGEDIAKLRDDQITKTLTDVAKGFTHLNVKAEDFVAVAKGMTPEATASLTAILTTANAALAGSKVFGEIGSVGKAEENTGENHPIVKAAKLAADAAKAAKPAA